MVRRLHKLLQENGVKDDTLFLIYYLNERANVVVKTRFGETDPLSFMNIVKEGTVLGPVLNNVSLDRVCKESYSHNLGSVETRLLNLLMILQILTVIKARHKPVIEILSKYSTK